MKINPGTAIRLLSCLFAVGVTACLPATGQPGAFRLGVEAGGGPSWLSGTGQINDFHHTRLGISTGIAFEWALTDHLSVAGGAGFNRKGSRYDTEIYNSSGVLQVILHGKTRFDYLSVPLTVRVRSNGTFRFFAEAGAFTAFLLKETNQTDASIFSEENIVDSTDAFNKTDWGLVVGAGIDYPVSPRASFTFHVRYCPGLAGIRKNEAFGTIKTGTAEFLVGVLFNLKAAAEKPVNHDQ